VKLGIELDVCGRPGALTGLQEQRCAGPMIEIEAVDQIIGILVTLGERIKVKPLLDNL
jgi:hypothetical protein